MKRSMIGIMGHSGWLLSVTACLWCCQNPTNPPLQVREDDAEDTTDDNFDPAADRAAAGYGNGDGNRNLNKAGTTDSLIAAPPPVATPPQPVASPPPQVGAYASCGSGGEMGTTLKVAFEGSLYYVSTPQGYNNQKAWPLILGLHGDEGDPARSVNSSWKRVVNEQFIFVAPKAANPGGSWYQAKEQNSLWMDNLLKSLFAKYNIDLDRVYIWGLSGGAMFISSYASTRQHQFAAIQFNMGGSGSSWKRSSSPPLQECKIPARFVVSPTDKLRSSAFSLYELLQSQGHEAKWVDANCSGHCWDKVESATGARDWLLSHVRCQKARPAGCAP
jgi:predicted esterase